MPADDLVINVRQIAQYPLTAGAASGDLLLLQRGGLGSAYLSIDAARLVETVLAKGGDMAIGGALSAFSVSGGTLQFSNASFGILGAQQACITELSANFGDLAGVPIATIADVAASVTSFMGRTGAVNLLVEDIVCAGGAPIFSPRFAGAPRAETPASFSSSSRLATTAFVHRNSVEYISCLLKDHPFVFSFNGRTGDVVLTEQDILDAGGGEIFDSPVFTGVPIAPTAEPGTNTDQIATTAFVNAAISSSTIFAPIDSPSFTGVPSAPTAAPGSASGQLATTAFVTHAVEAATAGVSSFNTRTGAVVLTGGDISAAGGAMLVSPAFTGTPTAPTAAPGTDNTQIATTAFVIGTLGLGGVATFNGRSGAVTLTQADIIAAAGAPINGPLFTGVPAAPTAAPGTNTTQIATTAFVMASVNATVASFNGRVGAVSLLAADISAAGGAALASPAFTGTPTAPTPSLGTPNTQIATTAYVQAAIGAGAGVLSFNGRAGVITLTAADVNAAGGPYLPLAGGTLTGALILAADPTVALGAATRQYADTKLPLAGGTLTGPLTPAAAGIVGVTGASNAPAGAVGEVISVVISTPVILTSGATSTIATLPLPAGDWDVHGEVWFLAGGAGFVALHAGIGPTAATLPAAAALGVSRLSINTTSTVLFGPSVLAVMPLKACRVNSAAATSVFLVGQATFTAGSANATGIIWARRPR
jgi:hypothetical protein